MKIKKIVAGAAALSVAAAMAISASAGCINNVVDGDMVGGTSVTNAMWMIQLKVTGDTTIDRGVDLSKIDGVRFTISVTDDGMSRESWDGMIGGAIIISCGGGDLDGVTPTNDYDYNWSGAQNHASFWGVTDPELELYTDVNGNDDPSDDTETAVVTTKTGDYTYTLEALGFQNPFTTEGISDVGYYQVALSDWGSSLSLYDVQTCELLAADGSTIATFDTLGNEIGGGSEEPAESEEPEQSEAPAESEAPTTGDSSKPNTNTGAEGIAVAAGVAILATGAAIVAKKRK